MEVEDYEKDIYCFDQFILFDHVEFPSQMIRKGTFYHGI